MKLNDKGQCPVCLRKPLPYKRDGYYFCCKCDRRFSLPSGEWEANFKWIGSDQLRPHPNDCKCGDCPEG